MRQLASRLAFALAAAALSCPTPAAPALNAQVVGPDGAPVEDAVVFLHPVSDRKAAAHAPAPASIAQHDREFVPYPVSYTHLTLPTIYSV